MSGEREILLRAVAELTGLIHELRAHGRDASSYEARVRELVARLGKFPS